MQLPQTAPYVLLNQILKKKLCLTKMLSFECQTRYQWFLCKEYVLSTIAKETFSGGF